MGAPGINILVETGIQLVLIQSNNLGVDSSTAKRYTVDMAERIL